MASAGDAVAAPFWPREAPQSLQNRFPGGFSAPHEAQLIARGAPQSPQKRLSAGLSAPQLAQLVTFESLEGKVRLGEGDQ